MFLRQAARDRGPEVTGRRIQLACGREAAWAELQAAVARLGVVEQTDARAPSLVGRISDEGRPVRIVVSVLAGSVPQSSVLNIAVTGDDCDEAATSRLISQLVDA